MNIPRLFRARCARFPGSRFPPHRRGVNAAPNGEPTQAAAVADGQRHPHRVRLRQQHLDRRARRRHARAASRASRAQTTNPQFSPDGKCDRLQRRIRRQHRRLRRPGRGRRAEAADLASGRRQRAGLDARRQVDRVRVRRARPGRRAARRASGPCRSKAASRSRWRCRAPTRARSRPTARTSPTA